MLWKIRQISALQKRSILPTPKPVVTHAFPTLPYMTISQQEKVCRGGHGVGLPAKPHDLRETQIATSWTIFCSLNGILRVQKAMKSCDGKKLKIVRSVSPDP